MKVGRSEGVHSGSKVMKVPRDPRWAIPSQGIFPRLIHVTAIEVVQTLERVCRNVGY